MGLISDAEVAQFRDAGFFVTEPMFSASELDAVSAEFDHIWEEEIAAAELLGDESRLEYARTRPFIGQAHTRSALLAEFVKAPVYLEACARLIGPDAGTVLSPLPGEPALVRHGIVADGPPAVGLDPRRHVPVLRCGRRQRTRPERAIFPCRPVRARRLRPGRSAPDDDGHDDREQWYPGE